MGSIRALKTFAQFSLQIMQSCPFSYNTLHLNATVPLQRTQPSGISGIGSSICGFTCFDNRVANFFLHSKKINQNKIKNQFKLKTFKLAFNPLVKYQPH
jgi:hypothetical protein